MSKRPNWHNAEEGCCACSSRGKTPADHEKPAKGELEVWQPNSTDPPQWICTPCRTRFDAEERKGLR